ncbi:uncharacterized protein LOC125668129 [Ostrea edulis]|uniref:uncharacterized protein LOC125668129 n=1 Tax=Ostrea edulis TaxID=37623 RepID=UPI0024AECBBB|nr:uncharacterized protein LOC125668129 [Ostrea edulis]XP_048757900.2 uncharacterized protein LOC125668129 [Ostrea edulis]XP_056009138.1 uncharacterized protein LOC125668129 [Ostrea edulis]
MMRNYNKTWVLVLVGFCLGWLSTYIYYNGAMDSVVKLNQRRIASALSNIPNVYTPRPHKDLNIPNVYTPRPHKDLNIPNVYTQRPHKNLSTKQFPVHEIPTTKRYMEDNKSGIVFSRNMTMWKIQPGMCSTNTTAFHRAVLRTSVGSTPIFIYDPKNDIWVSGHIVKYGNWEGKHIDLIIDLLKQDPELQFLDIGANVGVFALPVALFGRRVLAIDALAMNIQRLCSSVIVGNFSDRIKIVYNALSDVHELVSLGKDNNNVGGTFVAKDKNSNKVRGSNIVGNYGTVQTITLNNILSLPNFDFKKVVIKIDVEGYENRVFKGAEQFFDNVNVQAVLMEWMWLKTGNAGQEIIDFMLRKNMEPHIPDKLPNPLPVDRRANWPNDVLWRKKL